LGISGSSMDVVSVKERGRIGVGVDAHALAGHIVDHDRVGALAQQLGAAVFHAVLGLGGKADDELPRPAAAHHLGQNVFRRRKFQRQRTGALQLLLGDATGR
jgi:hypothetical protein